MLCHASDDHKQDGVAILISGKIHFKTKNVTRNKAKHFEMIKGFI